MFSDQQPQETKWLLPGKRLFYSRLLKSAFLPYHLSASNPFTLMTAHPDIHMGRVEVKSRNSFCGLRLTNLCPCPADASVSSSLKVKLTSKRRLVNRPQLKSKVVWGRRHCFWSPSSLGRRFMETLRTWRPAVAQTAALFLALVLSHLHSEGKTSRQPGESAEPPVLESCSTRFSFTVAANIFFFKVLQLFRKALDRTGFMLLFVPRPSVCSCCGPSLLPARSSGHAAVLLSLRGPLCAVAAVRPVEGPRQPAPVSLHQTQGFPEVQRRLSHDLQARQHRAHHPARPAAGLRPSRVFCEQEGRVPGLQRGAGPGGRWVWQVRGRGVRLCHVTETFVSLDSSALSTSAPNSRQNQSGRSIRFI